LSNEPLVRRDDTALGFHEPDSGVGGHVLRFDKVGGDDAGAAGDTLVAVDLTQQLMGVQWD